MTVTDPVAEIASLIAGSRYCVALTGAGISTESGLPDFRTPGSGLWDGWDPVAELSVQALTRDPERFYRAFLSLKRFGGASPNRAHLALAWMEERGLLKGVITQNVDGLHLAAGSRRVLEIHGHLRTGSCMDCRHLMPMTDLLAQVDGGIVPPRCPRCAEVVRPDVVLFGDPLPPCFQDAQAESRRADLMLVVGSSLQVWPAAALPALAGSLIIINLTATPYDRQARVTVHERAGDMLEAVRRVLEHGQA